MLTTTVEKAYLVSPKENPELTQLDVNGLGKRKIKALAQLDKDLAATQGKIAAIYEIFFSIKNKLDGILRYQRSYFITPGYKDTDSYKKAIMACYLAPRRYYPKSQSEAEKQTKSEQLEQKRNEQEIAADDAFIFVAGKSLENFNECRQFVEIVQELIRFETVQENQFSEFILKLKPKAYQLFKQELEQQTTLDKVLSYFALLRFPTNILRIHTQNILLQHGDTETYRHALFDIAKKVVTFESIHSLMEKTHLTLLLDKLNANKLPYEEEWPVVIDKLTRLILNKPATVIAEKKYLVSPAQETDQTKLTYLALGEQKEDALRQVDQDLLATNGVIGEVYAIFFLIKNKEKGILRYLRDHPAPQQYGNTTSYANAILQCFNAIHSCIVVHNDGQICLKFKYNLQSFQDYMQAFEIFQDACSCGHGYKDKMIHCITAIKSDAFHLFKRELEQQDSVSQALSYFALLQTPTNILRIHTTNLFATHGATDTYKNALIAIANKILTVGSYDPETEKSSLHLLLNELHANEPYFFAEKWQATVDKLANFILNKAAPIMHTNDEAFNPNANCLFIK